jgi:hypothetical protein
VEGWNLLECAEALPRVLMRRNCRSHCVYPLIPVGVIEVPMCIDKVLEWVVADGA